jgi:hypothetical protein
MSLDAKGDSLSHAIWWASSRFEPPDEVATAMKPVASSQICDVIVL